MQDEKKLKEKATFIPCSAKAGTRRGAGADKLAGPLDERGLRKDLREQIKKEKEDQDGRAGTSVTYDKKAVQTKVEQAEATVPNTGDAKNPDGTTETRDSGDNDSEASREYIDADNEFELENNNADTANNDNNDNNANNDHREATPAATMGEEEANGGARRKVKMEFMRPKIFNGDKDDDAYQWMTRFEKAAKFNRWNQSDILASFPAYIDGTAYRWYRCLNVIPGTWLDVPATAGQLDAAEQPAPVTKGLKTLFLEQFQEMEYKTFLKARLMTRKQKEGENIADYYFTKLEWCKDLKADMKEEKKMLYLFEGLCQETKKILFPLKPRTCKEFLELGQRIKMAREDEKGKEKRIEEDGRKKLDGASKNEKPVESRTTEKTQLVAAVTSDREKKQETCSRCQKLKKLTLKIQQQLQLDDSEEEEDND